MNQIDRAKLFHQLHKPGTPLVLYNVWDAGSALAVEASGAKAIATGSWSVAKAQGYQDGQHIPLDLVEQIAVGITEAVEAPVTLDFEGAYAVEPETVGRNVERLMGAGIVGINFEDQRVGEKGLHGIEAQCERIKAIRTRADSFGIPLFINARTDLFLKADDPSAHGELMEEAHERAKAYKEAGASGFFVPGLVDESFIADICKADLPINIMMRDNSPSIPRLAELGVARISYGPTPYVNLMKTLTEQATAIGAV